MIQKAFPTSCFIKYQMNEASTILVFLTLFVFLFPLNEYLAIFLSIVLIAWTLHIANINVLLVFLYISFFEEILIIPWIGGSLLRIITPVILYKLCKSIIPCCKLEKKAIIIFMFFYSSTMIGAITGNGQLESVIITINIAIFLLFIQILKEKDKEKILIQLCYTILSAVFTGFLWGIVHRKFMFETTGGLQIYRFSGVYEPNFMCFYFILAVIALFGIKNRIQKGQFNILLGLLIAGSGLTVSVTGNITLLFIFLCYLILNKENIINTFLNLFVSGCIGIVIFAVMQYLFTATPILEQNTNETIAYTTEQVPVGEESRNAIVERTEYLVHTVKEQNWDTLTSGRLPIVCDFFYASMYRNPFEFLIGNGPDTKKVFNSFFYDEKYSHNTYIDFLYNFGVIGFIFVISYILIKVKNNTFLGEKVASKQLRDSILLYKLSILIIGMALSLYSKKMVLLFFLL